MKNSFLILSMIMLSSCNEAFKVQQGSLTPAADKICSGTTILNVVGTADCSGSGGSSSSSDPIMMLSFSSRKDNASFPYLPGDFAAFFAAPDRVVASLQDEAEENETFTDNHSVIPSPLADSDGRYAPCLTDALWGCDYSDVPEYPVKRHYLETIAANDPVITSRANIVACGISGSIEARIADCATANGLWAFYDGKKYGQDGEGDWKLVSVLDNVGTKYEVWRDERTKLLWSDKSSTDYNWYRAAGYSKPSAVSVRETQFTSEPGVSENSAPFFVNQKLQQASPISVCPDVVGGEIAAGGGTPSYTYVNPETDFKAGLTYPKVTWRLPSINDWQLASINGIRKVLPNMDYDFWSASSYSECRNCVWYFNGGVGRSDYRYRDEKRYIRCVASQRD